MGLIPYLGGDGYHVNFIVKLLPKGKDKTFIEAFGGGGSVTLTVAEMKLYRKVIWNDKFYPLYSAFYVVKHYPEVLDVLDDMFKFFSEIAVDKEKREGLKTLGYYTMQDIVMSKIDDIVEAGIWTIVLYHFLEKPNIETPRVRNTSEVCQSIVLRRVKKLKYYHKLLREIEIRNDDAFKLLEEYNRLDAVFYLDPPHMGNREDYYFLRWQTEDCLKLQDLLLESKAKVLLKISDDDRPYYVDILKNWYCIEKSFPKINQPRKKSYTKILFCMNYRQSLKQWF